MRLINLIALSSILALTQGCSGGSGISPCATELSYVTDPEASGMEALRGASAYVASLFVGADDTYISAKLDTGSSQLIINEANFVAGSNTQLGKYGFEFDNGENRSVAINAVDSLQVGCSGEIDAHFGITAKSSPTANVLGLAFGDPSRLPHEANTEPFFDQLVKHSGLKNVISLSLCGPRGNSHVLLGGIDEKMQNRLTNLIPISEKSSYVVPALTLRLADSKAILGHFPAYDPKNKRGIKTILDSGASFNLWPTEMAEKAVLEISARAKELGLFGRFPSGFFRTERSATTKLFRFKNLSQIRQFPSFEITFQGADGHIKALELSPLHYFKEMSTIDPYVRTLAIRESEGPVTLGQPFMENHYLVFDRANSLIGFGDIDYACAR